MEDGFWAPLASPWPGATVGGVISARVNTPFRVLYGGISDLLMAVQVALPEGRLLRFGKALMKDVAGYAMKALFVGAYGTLGLVSEVTLRVRPIARAQASLMVSVPNLSKGAEWGLACLRAARNCAGLVLVSGVLEENHEEVTTLVFTSAGHPQDVDSEMREVCKVLESAGAGSILNTTTSATDLWAQALEPAECVLRAAVPAGKLPEYLSSLSTTLNPKESVVDLANGQVYYAPKRSDFEETGLSLINLRTGARSYAGHATLFAGPRPWLGKLDAWGEARDSRELMTRLKQRWDPGNILNRGEFVR